MSYREYTKAELLEIIQSPFFSEDYTEEEKVKIYVAITAFYDENEEEEDEEVVVVKKNRDNPDLRDRFPERGGGGFLLDSFEASEEEWYWMNKECTYIDRYYLALLGEQEWVNNFLPHRYRFSKHLEFMVEIINCKDEDGNDEE